MTRQQFIVVLIGILFCFCLLTKQSMQNYDILLDQPAAQEVVESLDSDDLIDVADDLFLPIFSFVPVCVLFSASLSLVLRYAQPLIESPHRPPSI